ncbi:DUF4398 domain-containing protein [Nitrosomonas sp.]|uniref:DUF4398 domain-containing protein n=1 Tax=Nitrosomonas sp. TaxID=42353 RepID=UPI0027241411|nr:DUF4398 domain-containing protein [Nitrosomonas sp.]MBK6957036.1 DUF4398 domain-containing protein [Nitrosomonas sp.]MDO8895677.1 DUF4398 domain-containing protein [Nitrosomonas sp.]MDP2224522.1 DUF4398 domain-containing protein [Nitrosomonas sp.]
MTHRLTRMKVIGVHGSLLQLITAVAILFSLVACATVPQPPNQELAAAETAINSADQARAVDYASAELQEARTKLAAARAAVQQEKMILAQQLAEQSRVDAELALAKAEAIKAKEINDEMMKSTDVMKQEMQRNTGDKQ